MNLLIGKHWFRLNFSERTCSDHIELYNSYLYVIAAILYNRAETELAVVIEHR